MNDEFIKQTTEYIKQFVSDESKRTRNPYDYADADI